jgi:hypothetical protein
MKLAKFVQDIKSGKMFGPCRAGMILLPFVLWVSILFCQLIFQFLSFSSSISPLQINKKSDKYNLDTVLYTVEFQKCRLPHGHIIFWVLMDTLEPTPEFIDSFISA